MSKGNGAAGHETPLPPHPADWLTPDISLSVCPPLTNNANSRSAEALDAVLDQFDVEHAARYRPRTLAEMELERKHLKGDALREALAALDRRGAKLTTCNVFASDVAAALCAPIPHQLGGKWQDVRDNAKWLRAGYNGWRPCVDHEAQRAANLGFPAVVVWVPAEGTGHIAFFTPSHGSSGLWICQSGARNYRRCPLMAGFGAHTTELQFYTHD